MILSAYERPDSPFVWIQYGADSRDRQCVKTAIRKTDREKKRKIALELNRIERQLLPSAQTIKQDGWRWVESFLATRYASQPSSLSSYRRQWNAVRIFLTEHEIESPSEVTRELLYEYPKWREKAFTSRRPTRLATAILGLKVLGLILDEAVNRRFIPDNPARRLKIKTEETPLRPEITDQMYEIIWKELRTRPDWMRKSFFLAINTGLRFATTRLHRSQIIGESIVIEKPKGGRRREFAIPIYDSIRVMIEDFVNSGDEWIWTAPTKGEGSLTGLEWSKFFRASAAYVPGLCFHSTRISYITRAMRAGIPEPVVMKMVNHASKDISRIYQRWTSEDVRSYAAKIPALGVGDGLK